MLSDKKQTSVNLVSAILKLTYHKAKMQQAVNQIVEISTKLVVVSQ